MDKTPNKSQSSLLGIFINILLPVLILDYCSAGPANPLERPEGENFLAYRPGMGPRHRPFPPPCLWYPFPGRLQEI